MSAARRKPALDAAPAQAGDLAASVRAGLGGPGPKWLPARFLYDELGSALFDAITLLPEYGLTRADERILRQHGAAIMDRLPPPLVVAEFGSGSGRKTRWILEAVAIRQPAPVLYLPIDVSPAALALCRRELSRIRGVAVEPIEADFLAGLDEIVRRRPPGRRLLVLFLGSTIGNFDRASAAHFLRDVRRLMRPGDAMLLGTDLVKPAARLIAGYDDSLGVTAAFNRNLLIRMNRELGAEFDPALFDHQALWNEPECRIEMHLRSRRAHAVAIRALGLLVPFRDGETIWTESSHKYEPEEPLRMAERAGFSCDAQWFDGEWAFAENLLIAR